LAAADEPGSPQKGSRRGSLIGLRWFARILYPDAFPEDLRPIVRDFYSRCYHQTPSEAQLDQLLRPSLPPA